LHYEFPLETIADMHRPSSPQFTTRDTYFDCRERALEETEAQIGERRSEVEGREAAAAAAIARAETDRLAVDAATNALRSEISMLEERRKHIFQSEENLKSAEARALREHAEIEMACHAAAAERAKAEAEASAARREAEIAARKASDAESQARVAYERTIREERRAGEMQAKCTEQVHRLEGLKADIVEASRKLEATRAEYHAFEAEKIELSSERTKVAEEKEYLRKERAILENRSK